MSVLTALATLPSLRRRLLVTLVAMGAYVAALQIPGPGVSLVNVQDCASRVGGLNGMVNLLGGGGAVRLSPLALGVIPYITASIILLLAGRVWGRARALQEDPHSRRTIAVTLALTVLLAGSSAGQLVIAARTPGGLMPDCDLAVLPGAAPVAVMAGAAMVLGSLLAFGVGTLVTKYGLGDGLSVFICTAILVAIPSELIRLGTSSGWVAAAGAVSLLLLLLVGLVWMHRQTWRSDMVAADRVADDDAPTAPLEIPSNPAGVFPVILGTVLLYLPGLIATMFPHASWAGWVNRTVADPTSWVHLVALAVLVVLFTFYQVIATWDAEQLSRRIRDNGLVVVGVEPEETAKFIDDVLLQLTIRASAVMAFLAVLPSIASGLLGTSQAFPLGGTALLILVAVGFTTATQLRKEIAAATPARSSADDADSDAPLDEVSARAKLINSQSSGPALPI